VILATPGLVEESQYGAGVARREMWIEQLRDHWFRNLLHLSHQKVPLYAHFLKNVSILTTSSHQPHQRHSNSSQHPPSRNTKETASCHKTIVSSITVQTSKLKRYSCKRLTYSILCLVQERIFTTQTPIETWISSRICGRHRLPARRIMHVLDCIHARASVVDG
jgi:hypothetical protein